MATRQAESVDQRLLAYRPAPRSLGQTLATHLDRPFFYIFPVIAVLLFLGIYPFVYNVRNSFREFDVVKGQMESVGWDNWNRLLDDDRFHGAILTTARYVGTALVIEFALGISIALLLNSGPWLSGLWQSLLILPMVVPPTITARMFGILMNSEFGAISWLLLKLNLIEKQEPLLGGTGEHALTAVMIPEIWQWTPFFVLILLAGMKALPTEPLEAAMVDGASTVQRFFHITLPMLRPMIAVAVLFRLVDLLKAFDYVYILTSGGPGTRTWLMSFDAYQRSFTTIEWGYGSVLALVILVFAIVLANIYVRVFNVGWGNDDGGR